MFFTADTYCKALNMGYAQFLGKLYPFHSEFQKSLTLPALGAPSFSRSPFLKTPK